LLTTHQPNSRGPALPARRPTSASASPTPPLTPRPHPSAPFFRLPSFFPAPSALCSVQPAAALWTSPRRGPTPIPAGPLDSPTRISFLLEASPLEPDHAEPLGDPLSPRAHHGHNPRRGVHAGHARPKSPASSLILTPPRPLRTHLATPSPQHPSAAASPCSAEVELVAPPRPLRSAAPQLRLDPAATSPWRQTSPRGLLSQHRALQHRTRT
jgi:hypothetical protein